MQKHKKVLYIVDMVNGFINEGVMHDEYISHTIDEQISLIKKFKKEKEVIAFIKDNHKETCSEFAIFPKHCIIGTSEADLIDELKKYEENALVYTKNSTSAMFAPGLVSDIEKATNLKEIVVCGCCTDICILNFVIPLKNYFNQMDRNINIYVIENATETYDSANHNRSEYNQMAYKLMKQAGIEVVKNLKELENKEKQTAKGAR